jgi:hypothetical protein
MSSLPSTLFRILKQNKDLSMKEGNLFCFVVMRSINWDASDHVLGVFGKLLMRRGAWAWFHDIWICGPKVLGY